MQNVSTARLLCMALYIAFFISVITGTAQASQSTQYTDATIASPQDKPKQAVFAEHLRILTDPMLTGPTPTSINVVWYLEDSADTPPASEYQHYVLVDTQQRRFKATTSPMTQLFEDKQSQLPAHIALDLPANQSVMRRPITRISATVTGLPRDQRTTYQAVSVIDGIAYHSDVFTLQPLPSRDQPVKVLVTSDQQNRHMSPANFQKVVETVGHVDAVKFCAVNGDTFRNTIAGRMDWNRGCRLSREGGSAYGQFRGPHEYRCVGVT